MWDKYRLHFVLVIALLSYHLHMVQFIHLNCTFITPIVLEHFHHPGFAFNRGRRPPTGPSGGLAALPWALLVNSGQVCVILLAAVVGASGRASQESH